MPWFSETDSDPGDQLTKAMSVPIGMMSPLWLAYGAVASAGVAFWLASKWAKPLNLEAEFSNLPVLSETLAALQPEPVAPDPAPDLDAPVAVAAEVIEDVAAAAEEAVDAIASAMSLAVDDLTRLAGIGPTLATKLGELGVRTYADIAAWTEEDLAKVDKALELRGRATREAWIDQARQFAAQ